MLIREKHKKTLTPSGAATVWWRNTTIQAANTRFLIGSSVANQR